MSAPAEAGSLLARKGKARPSIAREPTAPATALILHLDAERDARLRQVSTVTGRRAEQLVVEALDAFFATLPDSGELARRLPASDR